MLEGRVCHDWCERMSILLIISSETYMRLLIKQQFYSVAVFYSRRVGFSAGAFLMVSADCVPVSRFTFLCLAGLLY